MNKVFFLTKKLARYEILITFETIIFVNVKRL